MSGIVRLSEILADVWDRAHHIFPATRLKRTILRWLALSETETPQEIAWGTDGPMSFPHTWGTSQASYDIEWGTGVWA